MTATPTETRPAVSKPCIEGRHKRCGGTVAAWPLVDGKTLIDCACPVNECGHGAPDKGGRSNSNVVEHRRPTTLRGNPRD